MEKHEFDIDDELKRRFELKRDTSHSLLYDKGFVSTTCTKLGAIVIFNVLNPRESALLLDKIAQPVVCMELKYPHFVSVHDKGNEKGDEKGWTVRTFNINTKDLNVLHIPYPSDLEKSTGRIRSPQQVICDRKLLMVSSPDMLFLWLHEQMVFRAADFDKPAACVALQIGQGIKFASLDSDTNLLVLGAADMFQVWNLNNLRRVCEGSVTESYHSFHNVRLVEFTVITSTADCIQLWNIRRKFSPKYNNPITIKVSQPISHLAVDHHFILAGNLSGDTHLRNLYNGELLRVFDPYDSEWGGGIEFGDGLFSSAEGLMTAVKDKKKGDKLTGRKVDCCTRYGEWIFCAHVDPNLSFTIWHRSDAVSDSAKPVKTYKFKERIYRIILDPEDGRVLLLMRKRSGDSGRLFVRVLSPKLAGFGSDPLGKVYGEMEGFSWVYRLGLCRAKNLEIIAFLIASPKLKELTAEFGPNLGELQYGLSEVLWAAKDTPHLIRLPDVQLVDRIYLLLSELQVKLSDIVNRSKMRRVLSSISLRSKLEHLNSSLYRTVQEVQASVVREEVGGWLSVEIWGPPAAKRGKDVAPSKAGGPSSPTKGGTFGLRPVGRAPVDSRSSAGQSADEKQVSASLLRLNTGSKPGGEGGREWEVLFGERNYVSWGTFVDTLESKVVKGDISEAEVDMIAHVVDNSGTGFVSRNKFSEWLKGFGPLSCAVANTRAVICARWFNGFLSHTEAQLLLQNEAVGSFLVRFSESQPGGFTLAFVYQQGSSSRVLQTQIQHNPEARDTKERFIVKQKSAVKMFDTVPDIITAYARLLRTPFYSALLEKPWFLGDLSGDESRELLQGEPVGTFLIRFSASCPGNYALSFVNASGEVAHSSISRTPDGGYQTGHSVFKSMDDLVSAYTELLQIPYANTRSSIYELKRGLMAG